MSSGMQLHSNSARKLERVLVHIINFWVVIDIHLYYIRMFSGTSTSVSVRCEVINHYNSHISSRHNIMTWSLHVLVVYFLYNIVESTTLSPKLRSDNVICEVVTSRIQIWVCARAMHNGCDAVTCVGFSDHIKCSSRVTDFSNNIRILWPVILVSHECQ